MISVTGGCGIKTGEGPYGPYGRFDMLKVILAISMSSILFLSAASAQPRGGIIKAAHELGLTDDQMDKVADMRFEHQKEMIKKKAALKEARLELRHMMRNAEVDKKAALAAQGKISSIKADIARIKLGHRLEMRGVLSSGQLEKWMKMQRKHGFRERTHPIGECGHPGMGPKGEMGHGPDHDFGD